jgi:hypothetical protein
MTRIAIFAIASALVALAVACGGGGNKSGRSVASPSPPAPTATLETNASPVADPLLDDVINLAVQLNTMTREQATCVFGHEDILQEFLRITGLNKPGTLDEAKVKQQFGDLIRKYPVQLDSCFNRASG